MLLLGAVKTYLAAFFKCINSASINKWIRQMLFCCRHRCRWHSAC